MRVVQSALSLTFFFTQHLISAFKNLALVDANGRYHNIAVVKLSICHICFKCILSALYHTKWCLEAGITLDLQIVMSFKAVAGVGGAPATHKPVLHSVGDYHQRGVGWRHSTPGGA